MKTSALFVAATIASASSFAPAFAPATKAPQTTELNSIFRTISEMDLWEPVKDSNNYGARARKKVKQGSLSRNSYVPSGLTQAQYVQVRAQDAAKKAQTYQKNVDKAGKFTVFTDWYAKRGTNQMGSWMNRDNRGHTMAKTKYDWSGQEGKPIDTPLWSGIDIGKSKK